MSHGQGFEMPHAGVTRGHRAPAGAQRGVEAVAGASATRRGCREPGLLQEEHIIRAPDASQLLHGRLSLRPGGAVHRDDAGGFSSCFTRWLSSSGLAPCCSPCVSVLNQSLTASAGLLPRARCRAAALCLAAVCCWLHCPTIIDWGKTCGYLCEHGVANDIHPVLLTICKISIKDINPYMLIRK